MNKAIYDIKSRISSSAFWLLLPILYYVDWERKVGLRSRNPFPFDLTDAYWWKYAWKPMLVTIIYVGLLFHFSKLLEEKIPHEKRNVAIILTYVCTLVIIIGEAAGFGSGNKELLAKLGIATGIFAGVMIYTNFVKVRKSLEE